MKVNVYKYDEEGTHSLSNAIGFQALIDTYEPIYRNRVLSSLKLFKQKFGRQQITKNYSHRNWVWTFQSDDGKAVIYCLVNEQQGIAWEYDRAVSDEASLLPLMNEIVAALTK